MPTTLRNADILFNNGTIQDSAALNNALGNGQTWQNLTASRALNTTYTNSTGKPILVWLSMSYGDLAMYIGTELIWFFGYSTQSRAMMVVPPGQNYSATAAAGRTFDKWFEYR